MGHIELATPCTHIWYVKDVPSKIGALLNLSTSQLEQVLYFAKYVVTNPLDALRDGRPLRAGDLLTDDEYRQLRYGHQETYSVAMGEDAVVGDGEYVEAGQSLAKGVKSKLTGLAQYRFPRKLVFDYEEEKEAFLSVPTKAWIEGERYTGGQPFAELAGDLTVTAKDEGIVELLPIGTDGGILNLRNPDDEKIITSHFLPTGMELLTGDGELVEAGAELARAGAGTTLSIPRGAAGAASPRAASAAPKPS
jgi:DNA-directed RNA polymerase subunit beta'